jgi:oligoendopeptidase F
MTDCGRVSFAGASEGVVGAPAANASSSAASPATDLGPLPQWRLGDLYDGMDSPQFAADLARAAADAKRFAATYQGKLAGLAESAEAGPQCSRRSAPMKRCRT